LADVEGAALQSIDPAATAWLLASTALVLLMTPGLAIFYGGMVRTTGVLNIIMMSFIAIPLVTVAWLLVGYTLAFSGTGAFGLIGDFSHLTMAGIAPDTAHGAVPELLFATFQLSFAIITAALVSGAIADRATCLDYDHGPQQGLGDGLHRASEDRVGGCRREPGRRRCWGGAGPPCVRRGWRAALFFGRRPARHRLKYREDQPAGPPPGRRRTAGPRVGARRSD
jgi:hypothetical protein